MTNENTSGPCVAAGCEEPRKSFPSGVVSRRCAKHESERVQDAKRRRVVDPETGREMSAGVLAWYRWRRKRDAAAGEGA